jgi:DNA repair exonuclease SbcCD ATPase subunit
MNISNDTPALNYVEYFTKQLPVDLATMAALRDELAIRQGALSAAQDAMADRAKAAAELTAAKEQSTALVASAKEKNDKAKVKVDELDARELDLASQVKSFETSSAERNAALTIRENTFDTRERRQSENQIRLDALEAKLTADQANLDVRVKDFQAKVAALTA